MKTKQSGYKMSVSSSNLEDSIGGIVGNRITGNLAREHKNQ